MMSLQSDLFDIAEIDPVVVGFVDVQPAICRRGYVEFNADVVRGLVFEKCQSDFVSGFDFFEATGMYPGDVSLELTLMVKEGLVEAKKHFYGSDSLSSPGYFGFYESYKVASKVASLC